MKPRILLFSCEHAVNDVPVFYQAFFSSSQSLLQSHRGYDQGALAIARHLSMALDSQLIAANATRLLIDCNRSLHHPQCFSDITRNVSQDIKESIKQDFYLPYRQAVESAILTPIQTGMQVWHLSIHSFTPVLEKQIRRTELGLLYDPERRGEKELAMQWQQRLRQQAPALRTRRNYPYKGISDGLITALRRTYAEQDYLGLELEVNQTLLQKTDDIDAIARLLSSSLKTVVQA